MKNVSDKRCRERTHILRAVIYFSGKSYNSWEDAEKYSRARQAAGDSIIRGLHSACSITKATDTQSEYVTFTALPRQQ